MAKIIGLPKLSPTMEEGTLLSWEKKEGEDVEVDDLLAEVETDKATMEFRSFDRGVLLKILVPAGETLEPDVPVAIIGKRDEDISELLAQLEQKTSDSKPEASADPSPESRVPSPESRIPSLESQVSSPAPTQSSGRTLSSPLVRRLARERGLDLSGIQGSGPRGRIVKRDLEDGVGAKSAVPGKRAPAQLEKASSMRRTIARRLTQSKTTIPHYYLTIDTDADPLWNARKSINEDLIEQGDKISPNDLIIKACALALKRVPEVNSSWIDGVIHRHQVVDIAVAVAIDDGLLTPVVRDADQLGVLEISRHVRELALRARERKLKPEEMTGGTFSISSLGMFGIDEFSAVINPPEGAILAVGAIREDVVVRDGQLSAGRKMKLTMSCDHRIIDGAVGARFMDELRTMIEAPLSMLL